MTWLIAWSIAATVGLVALIAWAFLRQPAHNNIADVSVAAGKVDAEADELQANAGKASVQNNLIAEAKQPWPNR